MKLSKTLTVKKKQFKYLNMLMVINNDISTFKHNFTAYR